MQKILVVGTPTSGKSTFIHGLVLKCIEGGRYVAVYSPDHYASDDFPVWMRNHEHTDLVIVEWQLSVCSSAVPGELKESLEEHLGYTFDAIYKVEKIR